MALSTKTIDPDVPVNERIAAAIQTRLEDGQLPCTAACDLAEALGVAPIEVGRTADQVRIRLSACQLGLFGYTGRVKGWELDGVASRPAPDGLAGALYSARNERGEISCEELWRAAERFALERVHAACVADRLGIKIRECDLGAF